MTIPAWNLYKRKSFQNIEQLYFAELSGDYNPLHVDEIYARRTLMGRTVVHGVHLVLWALESIIMTLGESVKVDEIEVEFSDSVGIDEDVELRCRQNNIKDYEFILVVGECHVVHGKCRFSLIDDILIGAKLASQGEKIECRNFSKDDISNAQGSLSLWLDKKLLKQKFPNLLKYLPGSQIASLLATTRLVGMECPGLYSTFVSFKLFFEGISNIAESLQYLVRKIDTRFSLVWLDVEAEGVRGDIQAFLRPEAPKPMSYLEIRSLISTSEFCHQKALVVGGSRGLGEVTAKILAAGSADVTITYCRGKEDAARVRDEIKLGGGKIAMLQLDVLKNSMRFQDQSKKFREFDHLYYFATPFIFSAQKSHYSPELFEKFCKYYVNGLVNTVMGLMSFTHKLNVFYPSTVAIDELPPNLGEYVAAKSAGESTCKFLQKIKKGINFYCPRLPRLDTDQTASIIPVQSSPVFPLMLGEIRAMTEIFLMKL